MKYKTTAKAIREGAINPRSARYCETQYLLRNHKPNAYTCGVYGWNFDIYEVYGVTICTGYCGMVGKRLEGIAEAEAKAAKIWENCDKSVTWEDKCKAVEELLHDFCKANGGY